MMSTFLKLLSTDYFAYKGDPDSQSCRDAKYNFIARSQPAYISLIYPLVCIMLALGFGKTIGNFTEPTWRYVFNMLLSVGLFVPALFFFYKMFIREISIYIVEDIAFKILGQIKRIPLIKGKIGRRMPYKDRQMLYELAKTKVGIEFTAREKKRLNKEEVQNWTSDEKKSLNDKIEALNHEVRNDENVKANPIQFEYNYIYGFFRNLVGGLVFDFLLAAIYKIWFLISSESSFIKDMPEDLKAFMGSSWIWLLVLVILVTILAWSTGIRHQSRRYQLYLSEYREKILNTASNINQTGS